MCFRRHCPVLIIGQNIEVWVEHCPSGVMTSCTLYCWARFSISILVVFVLSVFILRVGIGRWSLSAGSWSLLEVVALEQLVESLKKFQAHFEVLHRLRLNPWACASWPLANHSASSLPPWFSSPSVLWTVSLFSLWRP